MVKAVLSFSVVTCVLTSSMDGPGVKSLIFFVTVSLHVEPELFWNSQIALELYALGCGWLLPIVPSLKGHSSVW